MAYNPTAYNLLLQRSLMIRRATVLLTAMVTAIVVAGGMGLSQTAPVSPQYTIKDLGTLGGTSSFSSSTLANDINDSSQIVGRSITSSGSSHAFLYSGGQMKDLGTLPGDIKSGAADINDSGQILGYSLTSSGGLRTFLYSGGQMKDFSMLSGGTDVVARSINNTGQIVGESNSNSGSQHAFLYSGGEMKDLGTLGGAWSIAYGVNDSGQVVGSSSISKGTQRAFLYSGAQMHDLTTLLPAGCGWILREAQEINTSGQIVGRGELNGQKRAFLATPATTPPLDSTAPKVVCTSLANNATGIASSANVSATFSKAMDASTTDGDPSTINGTTFKLVKLNSDGTTTRVTATVSYAASTKKAILNPSSDLTSGAT